MRTVATLSSCCAPPQPACPAHRHRASPSRSEEISQTRLNKMRGVTSHDRIDEELYQDYETEEAKQVRSWLWTGCLTCAPAC